MQKFLVRKNMPEIFIEPKDFNSHKKIIPFLLLELCELLEHREELISKIILLLIISYKLKILLKKILLFLSFYNIIIIKIHIYPLNNKYIRKHFNIR